MTPKSLILVALSAVTFVGAAANAYIVPGRPNPPPYPGPGPHPHPGPGPGPHPGPGPQPPPHQPPPSPYPGTYTRTIYVGRVVTNTAFALREMGDLDRSYRGMIVDSVRVDVRPVGYRADLRLAVNGNIDSVATNVSYSTTLYPRYSYRIGYDLSALRLDVLGTLQVDQIVIVLRDGGYNPPPPGGGELSVPVSIYRTVYGSAYIDMNQYINLGQYRGYRVRSIEVTARASYNAAVIDVLVNSFAIGSIQVDQYSRVGSVYPGSNSVIGQGFDNLVLSARGDQTIESVTLRLSRY